MVSKCRDLAATVLDGGDDEQRDFDATKRCKVHTNQLRLHATDTAICATTLGHTGGMAGHTDHRAAWQLCDRLHLSPTSSPSTPSQSLTHSRDQKMRVAYRSQQCTQMCRHRRLR